MDKKIKILNITVRADYGGGPEHLYRLCKNLPGKFDIFIAAPKDKPYWKRFGNLIGPNKLIEIPHRKFALRELLKLALLVYKNKIEIIHSHGKGAGIYSRLLKLLCPGVKIIHTFHGLHIGKYSNTSKKLYLLLEKILGILTTRFIAVSKSEKDNIISNNFIDKANIQVIENGVDIDPSDNLDLEQFQSNLIVHVTRFDYQKNTEFLLEIARRITNDNELKNVKFIILGEGENKKDFENQVNEYGLSKMFEIVGAVCNVRTYFKKSKMIISTSRWEGLPIALLEAMSCGLPVIATDVTGNNEVVIDNYNGYLYNENEISEVIKCIKNIWNKESLWRKYSNNSLKLVKEKYNVKTMAEKTSQLYEKVMMR